MQNRIEINIYLTAKIQEDDVTNIIVQDVGADKDAITSLRAPTHFGRPNWDRVFPSIANKHPETDVGVFFCGPPVLSRQLHQMCNKYSTPGGTRFFFGKGTFLYRFCTPCLLSNPANIGMCRELLDPKGTRNTHFTGTFYERHFANPTPTHLSIHIPFFYRHRHVRRL